MTLEPLLEALAIHDLDGHGLDRLDRRGPRLGEDERDLAEDVAGAHLAEHARGPIDRLHGAAAAAGDYVRLGAALAFRHDPIAGGVAADGGGQTAAEVSLERLAEV